MYKAHRAKPKTYDYDLLVVGTGAGGGVAAHMVAAAGKKVGVIEQEKIGGECPNYGCVPTKAVLQAAELYKAIHEAKDFGISVGTVKANHQDIKAWKDLAVKNTGACDGQHVFESEGIDVIQGHAHFLSPHILSVGKKRFSAKQFVIATGTHDAVPPIAGLEASGYMGYRDALELTTLPKSLFIIGGGAIGCEFAEYFSAFDVDVHIAEFTPRLLNKEDAEMGELIEALFDHRGVEVHTDTKVVKVEKKGAKKIVHYEKNGTLHKATVDGVLLATGKAPNTDLGLENAGVEYTRRGITVNKEMQTSAPHIYAAGDVAGPYMFTHMASYQSRIVGHNILNPRIKQRADYHAVPRCVFVDPECAAVGATEDELKQRGTEYQSAIVPIDCVGRANVTQRDTGFVKILANKKGVVLGGSIVAPRAGEMIHELALATQWRMKASKINYTIHAYPTWSQAVRVCASKINCR